MQTIQRTDQATARNPQDGTTQPAIAPVAKAEQLALAKARSLALDELGAEAQQAYRASIRHRDESLVNLKLSLVRAIECGAILCRAKQLTPHGKWLKWLADNIPEICQETAWRWMKLSSNLAHVQNMEDGQGLRAAYIAAGIIQPDPPKKEPVKAIGTSSSSLYETARERFSTRYASVLSLWDEAQPMEWPPNERAQLKAELEPLAKLWGAL